MLLKSINCCCSNCVLLYIVISLACINTIRHVYIITVHTMFSPAECCYTVSDHAVFRLCMHVQMHSMAVKYTERVFGGNNSKLIGLLLEQSKLLIMLVRVILCFY